MKKESIITERPSKYVLLYGMPLRDIAKKFGVSLSTVHGWLNDPNKKKWVEEKLKERK
ncbi:hypothetical protein ES708_17159 [subsurface metagenome]